MQQNWFDKNADNYKAARPEYPAELFTFLSSQTSRHDLAIDCGAGNGQATIPLASYFNKVVGLDVGANQIAAAPKKENVGYLLSSADALPVAGGSVDLVTSATAAHWFDLDKFFNEVDRVLKPGGVLALWSYYMPVVEPKIDAVVKNLFENTLSEYVDKRRKWIINGYDDMPFPYEPKRKEVFSYSIKGDFNRFVAVLDASSLVQRRKESTGINPLRDVVGHLEELWDPTSHPTRTMTWNHHMVIGRKPA